MDKKILKKANDILSEKGKYISSNNFKLIELEENYCSLEGTITENSLNPYNTVHGGYIFGLADTAGGTIARINGGSPVTSSASITFLHKGKGSKLIAKAKSIKRGKTLTICEVEIFDEENILVAKVILEYFNL